MRFILSLFLLFAFLSFSSSTRTFLKESLQNAPSSFGWSDLGRVDSGRLLEMQIGVKQSNVDLLTPLLLSVSDPRSPSYGKYLTNAEVNELVAPKAESLREILNWLQSAGVDLSTVRHTPNSDMLSFLVPIATAERLLGTEYHEYHHNQRNMKVVRATKYSLPESVHGIIDFIAPTVRFPQHGGPVAHDVFSASSTKKVNYGPSQCTLGVTPECLRAIYSVPEDLIATNANNSVAVLGYLEQYISLTDLQKFYTKYDAKLSGQKPVIIGPNVENKPGVEASLDIQYITALARGVPSTFWYVAGRQPNTTQPDNEPFLVWLQDLASTDNAPLVFSTSYGDNEYTVLQDYANRVNVEFQKAGLRGISLLYSSGDGGVAGGQTTACPDGKFIPTFPAGSPWVTAVGGTTNANAETAVSFSSGGFATYFTRPSYQTDSVNLYLTKYGTNLPDASKYSGSTGRGFPDVAALGTNFPVIISGLSLPVSGTSASAPAFAGVVGLLNEVRLNAGKSPLGFLNPLFYQHPEGFNDITTGNNPGCNTNGFYASQGWDPVTGLGTPNYSKLATIVASLP